MSRARPTVLACLEREIPRGSRLLVALSGGLDSAVLLRGLLQLKGKLALTVEAAHVDHALRAKSAQDADFVSRLCSQLEVPLHLSRLSPPKESGNVEAWGREERYSFFSQCLIQRKLDFTVTAHQANDCAETLLMRLLSNKEPRGILAWDPQRRLRRPLLDLGRRELADFAQQHGVSWVEDESNSDVDFLRNKIRHQLIPVLEREFGERIVETLALRGRALADDMWALDDMVRPTLRKLEALSFGSKDWLSTLQAELANLALALRWRAVAGLLKPALGFELGRPAAQRVLHFIESGEEGVELGGGLSLKRRNGGVEIFRNPH